MNFRMGPAVQFLSSPVLSPAQAASAAFPSPFGCFMLTGKVTGLTVPASGAGDCPYVCCQRRGRPSHLQVRLKIEIGEGQVENTATGESCDF